MIVIKVKGLEQVQKNLSRYGKELPRGAQRGMQRVAEFGARQYKLSAKRAGLNNGVGYGGTHLLKDTRAVKRGKNWVVVMPVQGFFQDRMKPHWVNLRRGRSITKWARQHGIGTEIGAIYTTPHPFIRRADAIIRKNAKPIMEQEINKVLKRRT